MSCVPKHVALLSLYFALHISSTLQASRMSFGPSEWRDTFQRCLVSSIYWDGSGQVGLNQLYMLLSIFCPFFSRMMNSSEQVSFYSFGHMEYQTSNHREVVAERFSVFCAMKANWPDLSHSVKAPRNAHAARCVSSGDPFLAAGLFFEITALFEWQILCMLTDTGTLRL